MKIVGLVAVAGVTSEKEGRCVVHDLWHLLIIIYVPNWEKNNSL